MVAVIQGLIPDVTTIGTALLGVMLIVYGYYVVYNMIHGDDVYDTRHFDGRRWRDGEGDGMWKLGDD